MTSVEEHKPVEKRTLVDRLVEIATAVLLSAATIASAWCAYQSERWGGTQNFNLYAADVADRQAGELSIKANQTRILDMVIFMRFLTAVEQDNKTLQQKYLASLRPEIRSSVEAWQAAQSLSSTNSPQQAPVMPEYKLPIDDKISELLHKSDQYQKEAVNAKLTSQQYLRMTVLLASVLFFGGLATHFITSHVKIAVFGLGILTFLGTLYWLTLCPVAL